MFVTAELTGSIVTKIQIAVGLTITAGSTVNATSNDLDVSDAANIAVSVQKTNVGVGVPAQPMDIIYNPLGKSYLSATTTFPLVGGGTAMSNFWAHTNFQRVIDTACQIRVKNGDTVDGVYNVNLIKTRV